MPRPWPQGPKVERPTEFQIRCRFAKLVRTGVGARRRPNLALTLRVPEDVYRLVARRAGFEGVSFDRFVMDLLRSWLRDEDGFDGTLDSVLDCVEAIAVQARLPVSVLLQRSLVEWACEMEGRVVGSGA